MKGISGSSSAVSARRIRLFACPRNPRRIKLCRERIAFTICGTTVSSYPTMPGNIGLPSRSRDIRFSRSSSFTRRELRRCAVKGLWRNSPRVRAELMVGNLRRKKPYSDYTAASVAALSDEASGGKDTLLRDRTLQHGAGKPELRNSEAVLTTGGTGVHSEDPQRNSKCDSMSPVYPCARRGNALCSLRGRRGKPYRYES